MTDSNTLPETPETPAAGPTERVADFMPIRNWVAFHGGDMFRTFSSMDWFIRRNRERLLASGQLIIRNGPGGNVVGPRFDDIVLEILREREGEKVAA